MIVTSNLLEKTTRNTLKLLEQMAANASLQDENILQATIEKSEISEQHKALIIAQNSQELAKALQLDKLITAVIIHSPDEDDDEQEEQQPEENVHALG